MPLLLLSTLIRNPQHKINNHRQQKNDGQKRRAKAIIEPSLSPQPNGLRPPVIRVQSVDHGSHGHGSKEESGDKGWSVAEVQHADGEGAEDHGEVEPGEEGSLVGEEDFGFDARGEGDALAWSGLEKRSARHCEGRGLFGIVFV